MLFDAHADPSKSLRIIGIDPGSTTMGVGGIEVDAATGEIISCAATTLNAGKMHCSELDAATHSDRYARIFALSYALRSIFEEARPTMVVCESPFMSRRRPMAYGALMETVFAVRTALHSYDSTIALDLVDPPTAKNAVGAKGNAGKEDVLKALLVIKTKIRYSEELSGRAMAELDEHSSDSLAIAFWRYRLYAGL